MGWVVTYENNRGESVCLTSHPYYLDIEPLLDYQWSYATKEYRRGKVIAGFAKDIAKDNLVLHILGKTEAYRNLAVDEFNNIIEKDIYDGKAGRIWFRDPKVSEANDKGWFTYCYILGSDNQRWHRGMPVVKKTIAYTREKQAWYHITSRSTFKDSEDEYEPEHVDGVKSFDDSYDFGYDYLWNSQSMTSVVNPSVLGSEFVVTIQGPVNDPQIEIGDTVIHVDIEVPDGAYLEVDSTKKTVILKLADGTIINAFGARDLEYNIFRRIDSGANAIQWNGAFLWTITLIEERSEPRWLTV